MSETPAGGAHLTPQQYIQQLQGEIAVYERWLENAEAHIRELEELLGIPKGSDEWRGRWATHGS